MPWLSHLLAVWSWLSYLTSQNFNILEVTSPGLSWLSHWLALGQEGCARGSKKPLQALIFYNFMAPLLSTEKHTRLMIFSFSREKIARNVCSFWFLKVCFRQGLAVVAGSSTAFSPLMSVSDRCRGRRAHLCVAVPGLSWGVMSQASQNHPGAEAPSCPVVCLLESDSCSLLL